MISDIFIDEKGNYKLRKTPVEEIVIKFDFSAYLEAAGSSIQSVVVSSSDEMETEYGGHVAGVVSVLAKAGEVGIQGWVGCLVTTADDLPEKLFSRIYFDIVS